MATFKWKDATFKQHVQKSIGRGMLRAGIALHKVMDTTVQRAAAKAAQTVMMYPDARVTDFWNQTLAVKQISWDRVRVGSTLVLPVPHLLWLEKGKTLRPEKVTMLPIPTGLAGKQERRKFPKTLYDDPNLILVVDGRFGVKKQPGFRPARKGTPHSGGTATLNQFSGTPGFHSGGWGQALFTLENVFVVPSIPWANPALRAARPAMLAEMNKTLNARGVIAAVGLK